MAHAQLPEFPEYIFIQTDPAFDYVLKATVELKRQDRLVTLKDQTAELQDIESNDKEEERKFQFGGGKKDPSKAFGQTASAVVRMCMLEAVQINRDFWPKMGNNSQRRNRKKVIFTSHRPSTVPFTLTEDKSTAKKYWSKYDQFYPHFLIEEKVSGNQRASMPSMMLIFRKNFSELVEITTTFTAMRRHNPADQFDSFVNVFCAVREIKSPKGVDDGEYTCLLKGMMKPADGDLGTLSNYFFEKLDLDDDEEEERQ